FARRSADRQRRASAARILYRPGATAGCVGERPRGNPTMTSPYKLTLDLRVLDHLGIKLYSNAAAVLSEAVANAWDADAELGKVGIGQTRITIEDNGIGMDLKQVNDRFLSVGYDKRAEEGETSGKGRPFMGRKGIGKLALFSIADEIEVQTRAGTEKHA